MTDQDLQQIKEYVEKKIKLIIPPEHWTEMVKRNLEHSYVVEVLTTKYNFGDDGANKIANDVDAMLKACAATNTGVQTVKVSPPSKSSSGVLRWVLGGLLGILLIGLVLGFFLLYKRVDRLTDQSERITALETKIDTFDTKKADRTYVDEQLNGLTKSVTNLTKSTDGLLEKVEKLTGEVGNKLNKSEFSDETAKIHGELDKKADKADLAKEHQRLREVENKLDAHIDEMKARLADKVDVGEPMDPYPDETPVAVTQQDILVDVVHHRAEGN